VSSRGKVIADDIHLRRITPQQQQKWVLQGQRHPDSKRIDLKQTGFNQTYPAQSHNQSHQADPFQPIHFDAEKASRRGHLTERFQRRHEVLRHHCEQKPNRVGGGKCGNQGSISNRNQPPSPSFARSSEGPIDEIASMSTPTQSQAWEKVQPVGGQLLDQDEQFKLHPCGTIMNNNSETSLERRSFSESEGQGWCADDRGLDDPRPLEPHMRIVGSEQSWGFHPRAEMLNGRLAMLGFLSGILIEWFTGQGILQQIGLKALMHHP
jgi:hypothetical protein